MPSDPTTIRLDLDATNVAAVSRGAPVGSRLPQARFALRTGEVVECHWTDAEGARVVPAWLLGLMGARMPGSEHAP